MSQRSIGFERGVPTPLKPAKEICVHLKGIFFADADNCIYPRFLQERRAAPMHARVGVYNGYDALGNARFY
jgi:hypothetical protein